MLRLKRIVAALLMCAQLTSLPAFAKLDGKTNQDVKAQVDLLSEQPYLDVRPALQIKLSHDEETFAEFNKIYKELAQKKMTVTFGEVVKAYNQRHNLKEKADMGIIIIICAIAAGGAGAAGGYLMGSIKGYQKGYGAGHAMGKVDQRISDLQLQKEANKIGGNCGSNVSQMIKDTKPSSGNPSPQNATAPSDASS